MINISNDSDHFRDSSKMRDYRSPSTTSGTLSTGGPEVNSQNGYVSRGSEETPSVDYDDDSWWRGKLPEDTRRGSRWSVSELRVSGTTVTMAASINKYNNSSVSPHWVFRVSG